MVYNKVYVSHDETDLDLECKLSDVLRAKMQQDNKRYWAGDNISEYVGEKDKEQLINEATIAFEGVLDTLLIDRKTDPNSIGTARRLAKMYFNELMSGRYDPTPNATAFPNNTEGKYEGMLVVRSELKSVCSHHHQPVTAVAAARRQGWRVPPGPGPHRPAHVDQRPVFL